MSDGRLIRDIFLAVASALFGAVITYLIQEITKPTAEISTLYTRLDTQTTGYALDPVDGTPMAAINKFAILNSGSSTFSPLKIAFSPAGGDSAYDGRFHQKILATSAGEEGRSGRPGSLITRSGNSIILTINAFLPDETETLTILSSPVAWDFDLKILTPNVHLKRAEVSTDFPSHWPLTIKEGLVVSWRWIAYFSGALIGLVVFSTFYIARRVTHA